MEFIICINTFTLIYKYIPLDIPKHQYKYIYIYIYIYIYVYIN